MGRSQRHKVIIQGTDSSGKGLSEKQAAPRYIIQAANSQPLTNWTGPAGGPLQGSTMAGFPPTLIPPPGGTELMDAELQATGEFTDPGQFNLSGNPIYEDLPDTNEPETPIDPPPEAENPRIVVINPNPLIAGMLDLSAMVNGTGFEDGAVIVFGGTDMATDFLSANQLRFLVPSSTTGVGDVAVVVRNPGGELSEEAMLTFNQEPAPPQREALEGPQGIVKVYRRDGKLVITVDDPTRILPGTIVTIEATGSSSVNGQYEVEAVEGNEIVVDSDFELEKPIEGKGRVIAKD